MQADSYKIHAKSDQFQKYVNMATNSLDDREVFEIQQQFIAEKRKPIFEINNIDIRNNKIPKKVTKIGLFKHLLLFINML